jgi:hypothetical protein
LERLFSKRLHFLGVVVEIVVSSQELMKFFRQFLVVFPLFEVILKELVLDQVGAFSTKVFS